MLDKEDLQAIQQLIIASEERTVQKIQESEERTMQKIQESEERTMRKIQESEERTMQKIQESEERTMQKIQESEERTSQRAAFLMEQEFSPKFGLLVERMQGIEEKLIPTSRVERLEDDVDLLKIVIRQMREDLDELKGA